MGEVWSVVITSLAAIFVAFIEVRGTRDRKRAEDRAARRAEESRLAMELMSANCALSLVTAKKVMGQHVNGDVEEAMQSAESAQSEYNKFLRRLASCQAVKI